MRLPAKNLCSDKTELRGYTQDMRATLSHFNLARDDEGIAHCNELRRRRAFIH